MYICFYGDFPCICLFGHSIESISVSGLWPKWLLILRAFCCFIVLLISVVYFYSEKNRFSSCGLVIVKCSSVSDEEVMFLTGLRSYGRGCGYHLLLFFF